MKSKGRALRGALTRFANDLRQVTQQLNDGVSFLNRTTQHKPCIGPIEFREVLSEIQEDVSDLTTDVENLERFTVDTISFEELLGHCLVLYQANRNTINNLEAHLQQYGYRQPPDVVAEPENPLSAEAVAAAKARLGAGDAAHAGGRDSSSSEDEADDEADHRCHTDLHGPAALSSHKPFAAAPATGGMAPMSFLDKYRRKGTPVAKGRLGSHSSSESEDEPGGVGGGGGGASDDESEARPGKRHAMQQRQQQYPGPTTTAGGGSFFAHARPTGDLTGKGQILMSTQAASLSAAITAAASVHASARKAPMPRAADMAANRDSFSPERDFSPNTRKLLAKYNPPAAEDESRVSISLAASFDKAGLPEIGASGCRPAAVRAEELSAALRDLAPFGQRGASGAVTAAVGGGAAGGRTQGPAPAPAFAAAAAAPPRQQAPAEEETSVLYNELIRSKLHCMQPVHPQQRPQLQHQPQQQQQPRPLVPALNLGQSAAGAPAQPAQGPSSARLPQPSAQPQGRIPPQLSPRPPLPPPAGGSTPEGERPTTTPGASRSVTPLSVLRANRQQHDKLLEEKLAGLERVWVESGQAALTPGAMRRSMGGGDMAAFLRAKSPGPSRAVAEAAAAAAAAATAACNAAAAARPVAGVAAATLAKAAWGPPQAEAPSSRVQGQQKNADAPAPARVLSPLQSSSPFSSSSAAANTDAATTPRRAARGSGLPGPPQAGATASTAAAAATASLATAASPPTPSAATATTVVGATTLPRHDSGNHDAALRGAAAKPVAVAAPRTTPGRPGRGIGTPGRVRQACGSPTVTAAVPATAALGRATEATTPRGAVRVAMTAAGGGAGGAAEARASKLTPHRRSYAAAPLEAATAAAAAAAATAAIEQGAATPNRARRIAMFATTNTTAAAAPGLFAGAGGARTAVDDAGAQGWGLGAAPARTYTAAAAPMVLQQLPFDACRRPDAEGGGGAWGGFPRARRGADGSSGVAERPATARTGAGSPRGAARGGVDEVTLTMPPTVSQPGTPTTLTPGGSRQGGGGGGAPASSTSTPVAFSPNAAKLASHPLGDFIGGAVRPTGAVSRIPTPGRAPSRLPTAAAAAAPPISGLEPCSEDEWRSLPASVQMAFPREVLNGHLRALAQVLAARPPSADAGGGGRCFSAADMEALSLGSVAAKRLLNALVKLGRCQVAGGIGIGGGAMLYRLPA